MKRPSYMFTNKSQPQRGIISALLGVIDIVSLGLSVWLTFKAKGNASARFGAVALFALLFSIAGLVLGILSRMEKDKFYLFPNIGIILNALVIICVGLILFSGVYGL